MKICVFGNSFNHLSEGFSLPDSAPARVGCLIPQRAADRTTSDDRIAIRPGEKIVPLTPLELFLTA